MIDMNNTDNGGNEMTTRKKKGIGYAISGAVFVAAAVVCFATQVTPDWVNTIFGIIGLVAGALGFQVVFPDTEE